MSGSVGTGGNAGIWRRAEQAPDDVAPGRGAPSENIEETHIMGQTQKKENVQERKEERREDKRDDRRDNNRDQDDKKDKDAKRNN